MTGRYVGEKYKSVGLPYQERERIVLFITYPGPFTKVATNNGCSMMTFDSMYLCDVLSGYNQTHITRYYLDGKRDPDDW